MGNTQTKQELNDMMKLQFGFNPEMHSAYGISSWKKDTLLSLCKIFTLYKIQVSKNATQCCLTKQQMAFQLQQGYERYGLVFTPHEIRYISRDGFILLYNALIEGRQGK
jgi:hypothetical protein